MSRSPPGHREATQDDDDERVDEASETIRPEQTVSNLAMCVRKIAKFPTKFLGTAVPLEGNKALVLSKTRFAQLSSTLFIHLLAE